MKFALSVFASATMAGLAACADPTQRLLAINAEYQALAPQLNELGVKALGAVGDAAGITIDLSGIDLSSISGLGGTPVPYYSGIDLAALRQNGYGDLANRLEKAAEHGAEAAEGGLVALKSIIASDGTDMDKLREANAAGLVASKAGLAALAELPTPESLSPADIENLRALGLDRVVESLVTTRRALEGVDKGANFLAALANLGVGPGAKKGAAKVASAVASRTPAAPAAPVVYRAPAYPGFQGRPMYTGFYSFPQFGGFNSYQNQGFNSYQGQAGLSPYYG